MDENTEELLANMDWSDVSFGGNTSQNTSSPEVTCDKYFGNTSTWQGVPITDIYCDNSPWSAPDTTPIIPAYNHAVLFHIPQSGAIKNATRPPTPQRGSDHWDKDHVRMPHSPQNLYPVKMADGTTELKNRWELIESALLTRIRSTEDLEKVILSYNTKYKNHWRFYALHSLFNDHLEEEESEQFFNVTLPGIIQLALSAPELLQSPIPLLRQHRNRSVSLSQQQVACLLANAFFCTFPRRNTMNSSSEYSSYPSINFHRLFQCRHNNALEKLKCIFHYFRRACTGVFPGVVTFTRRSIKLQDCPNWSKMKEPIGGTPLHVNSSGTIEDDGVGLLQVDFANKYLGGGVLNYGCVQEEIRFVICPELLISLLFTESLRPTEALIMIGCERYSNYTGYAETFSWSGNYEDGTPYDSCGRRKCTIVAIDALQVGRSASQYKPDFITRDLNKAWVGFSAELNSALNKKSHVFPGVATGNWGCGAFGGSPYLKALLQIMACTAAKRPIAYFTFNDTELRDDICNIYNFISKNNMTIGQLYKCLCNFHKFSTSNDQLYPFILQYQKDAASPKKPKTKENNPKVATPAPTNGSSEKNTDDEPSENSANFVDVEKGETKDLEPSTSFFDEFSKLEELKSKEKSKRTQCINVNEKEVPESEATRPESPSQTIEHEGKSSAKRAARKISDYFVPSKKS